MPCTLPCLGRHRYPRMLVLLIVLVMTSMEWAPAPEILCMKSSMLLFQNLYSSKRRSLKFLLSRHGCPVWIHISRKTLGDFSTRLTEMEQNFSALTARMCKFETNAASASNVSGLARSWPTLEQVDDSTAAGSDGPGSSDDNRNTRRRLDTLSSTEDEQSRSAVLLRFPCEQYLKGITKWIDNLWEESDMLACNNLSEFIAKQVPCQSGLFLKHEANAKTLLLDLRMMVFFCK